MKKTNVTYLISFIFFIFSILFFLYKTTLGLGYLPFSDESGHFIGAIAVNHGDLLYRDYIDAHGPLVFIATWLLGQLIGFAKVSLLRLVSTFFISIAGVTIFYSAIFIFLWQRLLAVYLWFASIALVWIVQGLYLDSYWTIGGALTVVGLSTLILPLLYESNITKINSFIGGISIGLLPFTAYPFSLVSVLFIFVILYLTIIKYKIYRTVLLTSFWGCLTAVIVILLWLFIYGDIGGMIAFHFIANQLWYAHYVPLSLIEFIKSLTPNFNSNHLVQNIAIYAFFLGCLFLFISTKVKYSVLLVVLGVLTLDLRGSIVFHNGAFLVASLGMFILSFIKISQNRPKVSIFVSLIILLIINFHVDYAVSTPAIKTLSEQKKVSWHLLQEEPSVKFVQEIQKYVKPSQRILIIPYSPDIYIYANRLPMKKYHEYLPWEADYAKHPWYGYDRDICVDLPKDKPPVIYLDSDRVWSIYFVKNYMGCVIDLINKEYSRMPGGSFVYVRKDMLEKH